MSVDLKDLLNPKKIIPIAMKRNGKESEGPVAVELHWTSDCNYDCIHCSYGSRRSQKGRLDHGLIDSLIEDLIGLNVQAVYLSGGGEPTVVKGWEGYVRRLLDAGIDCALITNGVTLKATYAELYGRMNYIAASIYSTNEAEYSIITDSRFFERQWEIPSIVKIAGGRCVVGARCVINKINYRRIPEIYSTALRSGYDYVLFIPAVDYEGRGISLGLSEQQEVGDIISSNIDLFDDRTTNLKDVLAKKIHHYEPAHYLDFFKRSRPECFSITMRANAFVNYCGGVWLCQPHIGEDKYAIGSLSKTRFQEIWNGYQHGRVIDSMNKEFGDGMCRDCRSISFNLALEMHNEGEITEPSVDYDPFI